MKKTLVLIALPLLIGFASRAQSDKYVAAMQKNLSLFDSTKTIDQYQSLAATFDRIGDAEKTQWLPLLLCRAGADFGRLEPGFEGQGRQFP